MWISIVSVLFFISGIAAQIPCDEAYGQHCPEASGYQVGECLKQIDQSLITSECANYINIHDNCKTDLEKYCAGNEYTGDALVCLTEWTKPEDLSQSCVEILPKKEVQEKKLSAKEKKKAAERKKRRNKAAKYAREL